MCPSDDNTLQYYFFRYSECVQASADGLPLWDTVNARELYNYEADPWEAKNVAEDPQYADTILELSQRLHSGWKQALI